jgi:hypothetical protein
MAQFVASNLILIKLETTYGVDASPTAADALLVNELTFPEMQGEIVDRNLIRPFMGGSSQAVVSERIGFGFTCEAAGSGTAGTAPRFGAGLQACRNAVTTVPASPGPGSNTYSPISVIGSANTSATIYYWIGGIRHIITGWRGSHSLNLTNNSNGINRFQGMGIYQGPTDTAILVPNYTLQAAPLPVTLGNTLNINIAGHTTAFLQSFAFTQENQMSYNSLPNGVKEVLITSGRSTFEAVIECPTIAQRDYFSAALTQATGALTITQGTTAGNRQAFSAPAAKTMIPAYNDDNGKLMLTVPGIILPVTGNDEYAHAFT